jgi:hypothetical protein
VKRLWSPAAEAKLRALYPTTPLPWLAFLLKRTEKAVRSRAKLLGIRRLPPPWTAYEDRTLRRRYPNERCKDIAADLGRSVSSTHQRARKLGLEKSDAFKASDLSGRVQRGKSHPAMRATQFRKGIPSWSKGTKGRVGVQEGCRATQFKKGRPAHEAANYQPIGTLRMSKDGYLERKFTDDPKLLPVRRWCGVHRLVWIEAFGPVPPSHAVCFKPGRFTTEEAAITPDALELVSRVDLMRRNSYHTRYPKEVAQLIQLRGALNRKLNRRTREESHG